MTRAVARYIEEELAEVLKYILPNRLLALQFVYLKRSATPNDDEPAVELGKRLIVHAKDYVEVQNVGATVAAVTQYIKKFGRSFHQRIREHHISDYPSVCVFSNSKRRESSTSAAPSVDAANVLYIKLPEYNGNAPLPRPPIELMVNHGHYWAVNLDEPLSAGLLERERVSSIRLADAKQIVVGAAHCKVRRARLNSLANSMLRDTTYLAHVASILRYGDIVLCAPHSASLQSADHYERAYELSAGLTAIVRKQGPVSESDWATLLLVSRKLTQVATSALAGQTEHLADITRRVIRNLHHTNVNGKSVIRKLITDAQAAGEYSAIDKRTITAPLDLVDEIIKCVPGWNVSDEAAEIDCPLLDILNLTADLYGRLGLNVTVRVEQLEHTFRVSLLWRIVIIELLQNARKYGNRMVEVRGRLIGESLYEARIRNSRGSIDGSRAGSGLDEVKQLARELRGDCVIEPGHDWFEVICTIPEVEAQ